MITQSKKDCEKIEIKENLMFELIEILLFISQRCKKNISFEFGGYMSLEKSRSINYTVYFISLNSEISTYASNLSHFGGI